MDTRMVVEDIFGLRPGDVNIIRNAGGVASLDAVRSLLLSRHILGTHEIVVLGHTGCGLQGLDDDDLRARLERQTGQPSKTQFGSFDDDLRVRLERQTGQQSKTQFGSFDDLDAHVRRQVERIQAHPWIGAVPVHGLVYEVETGLIREVA